MLKNKINEIINSLMNPNNQTIKSLILPSLGFELSSSPTNINLSKIGGLPPILKENWPIFDGKPLLFLGQLSLSQINEFNDILPVKGILCFYLCVDGISNRYPDRKGEFKVQYLEKEEQESLNVEFSVIKEFSISFFELFTFPSYQENIITKSDVSEEDLCLIEDIETEIQTIMSQNYDITHQILGHPKAIQGTVRFWWAMKYLGFDDVSVCSEHEISLIKQEEDKFILLLQLNFSDPKVEIDYFGESIAYFGIHQFDLQNANWHNVVLVMQNT